MPFDAYSPRVGIVKMGFNAFISFSELPMILYILDSLPSPFLGPIIPSMHKTIPKCCCEPFLPFLVMSHFHDLLLRANNPMVMM